VILLLRGSMAEIAAGAVLGGLATAVIVYALAYRGGVAGERLILIGIGVSALLLSANHYLITRAVLHDALAAQSWQTGSLNGRGWEHVWAVGAALVALLPLALYYSRRLALLGMGDDAARSLGVAVERSRLVLVVVSVALAAVAVAAAGPIPFLALAAPQLARRLTRSSGVALAPSAAMGALLLVAGDLATQRLFAPTPLPVGVATGVLGGLYLAWLLAREWRR
jgi:iron complex transport system permease protein